MFIDLWNAENVDASTVAIDPRAQSSEPADGFDVREMEISSTATRRMKNPG